MVSPLVKEDVPGAKLRLSADNLFAASFQDCIQTKNWGLAIEHLRHQKYWRSALWRYLCLPSLPQSIRKRFYGRWQNRSNPIPPWLKPISSRSSVIKQALEQYYAGFSQENLLSSMNWTTSCSGSVGASQVYKLYRHAMGLESASPLQDYRLIQFALNLPPVVQQDFSYNKIFLRRVNRKTLPEDLAWRPKTNYFDPLRYAGLGAGERVMTILDKLKNNSLLSAIIDVPAIERELRNYRADFSKNYAAQRYFQQDITNTLYAAFMFAFWYDNVSTKYGC